MKLLPCPFCGSTMLKKAHGWQRYVECLGCGVYGPGPIRSDDRDMQAISANQRWNERAELTELYLHNPRKKPRIGG